jgi:catechol 2,3-dioxygenase-like lactoylglutathione lyase family enzyme
MGNMRVLILSLAAAIAGCAASPKAGKPMSDTDYQLSVLKIPVSDINKSADFYRDTLKFKLEYVAEKYHWAQLSAGELPLALYEPGKGGGDAKIGGSTGFHLALVPQQFDALASDLLKRGVLVENQVQHSASGSTFVQVRDPDGNILNVSRAEAE